MKRTDRERLLRDVLASDEVARVRTASLDGMLAAARRRRRQRALLSAAGAALAAWLVAFVLTRRPEPVPSGERAPVAAAASRIRIIGDEELLRLFADRSVALVGRPGEQRLLFLEPAPAAAAPEKIR